MTDVHQNGLQQEHHATELLFPCRHREQQCWLEAWTSKLTSLWPAYEPMDCIGNITRLFFFCPKKRVTEFYALSNPVAAVLSTSYGAVWDLTYSSDRLSSSLWLGPECCGSWPRVGVTHSSNRSMNPCDGTRWSKLLFFSCLVWDK